MSGRRRSSGHPRVPPGPLLLSKLLVMLALAGALAFNCRSPHHLDAAAGDASEEPVVQLPFASSVWKLVGPLHLSWGLPAAAAGVAALATWFCLASGSPARQPWRRSEVAAAAACAGGAALRAWCFHELGRLFTYEVGIRQGHTLVQTGPYSLLLHPSYTGTALMVAGFAWWAAGPGACLRRRHVAAAYAAIGCALIALRVSYEERALEAHFGEAWRLHAAARRRFMPFLF
ncbi:hypothetical protein ABPG75_009012 [Micractinium tetrahymenae]